MTTIAWDGKTLASDTRCQSANVKLKMTKIFKHKGHLLGYAGPLDLASEMINWWKAGAKPKDFPEEQRDEDFRGDFVVITPKGDIIQYQKTPYPMDMNLNKFFAIGSGRDFAIAAMHLGKSAEEAVAIAGIYDSGTNDEIQTLCLD